jgi:hypothetical protein
MYMEPAMSSAALLLLLLLLVCVVAVVGLRDRSTEMGALSHIGSRRAVRRRFGHSPRDRQALH